MRWFFSITVCNWIEWFDRTAEVNYSPTGTLRDNQVVAILLQEPKKEVTIEIYNNERGHVWTMPFDGFVKSIQEAEAKLKVE